MSEAEELAKELITKTAGAAVLHKYEVQLKSILTKIANDSLKREKFYKGQLAKIAALVKAYDVDNIIPQYTFHKDLKAILAETYDDDTGHGDAGGAVDNAE